MWFQRVEVNHFRCIEDADISPSSGLNIIFGHNGSGKTSLLESLYMLGAAKSFRSRHVNEIIKIGKNVFRVQAMLSDQDGRLVPLGVRKSNDVTEIRYDSKKVGTSAELALQVPIIVITPDTHTEVQNQPRARRRLIDWTLFHVKHDYLGLWNRCMQCIKHRNHLLRRAASNKEIGSWNDELARISREIDAIRRACMYDYSETAMDLIRQLFDGDSQISYHSGWQVDRDYLGVLRDSMLGDREAGFTRFGPHRADLQFKLNGHEIRRWLSRGQMKLWVAALMVAQAMYIGKATSLVPVILVDDLISDLDPKAKESLIRFLVTSGSQVFLTTTDPTLVPTFNIREFALFHMEQGHVKEAA